MSIEWMMPSAHPVLCCPLLLMPSIFPSIRVFSNESSLCIRLPKCCSFSFSISSPSEYSGSTSFRIDWFDLLAVQGTLKALTESLKALILWSSAFFMVQLSHPCVTTGKTIALPVWTFVSKVMPLLFNILSRFVTAFLQRSNCPRPPSHYSWSWLCPLFLPLAASFSVSLYYMSPQPISGLQSPLAEIHFLSLLLPRGAILFPSSLLLSGLHEIVSVYCLIPARSTFSLFWKPQTLDMPFTVFISATNIPSTAPGIFWPLTHSSLCLQIPRDIADHVETDSETSGHKFKDIGAHTTQ